MADETSRLYRLVVCTESFEYVEEGEEKYFEEQERYICCFNKIANVDTSCLISST